MRRSDSPRLCEAVIVNYNAGPLIADCVESVLAHPDTRIIVVDNASTDGSIAALAQRFGTRAGLTIIRNPTNLGFATACNIGARATNADRILFLNPDSVLEPGALVALQTALDSDPRVGMVGALLCNPDGTEQRGGRRRFPTPGLAFARAFGLAWLSKHFPRLFPDFLEHEAPLPSTPIAVEAISGACMLVKRAAIEDVGLWDEAYFLHCEDLDWCMRFRQKGWRILFVPAARVTHAQGTCSRSRPVFVEWHKHRGMLRFYRKFYRTRYSLLMWGLVSAGVWLRFAAIAGYHGARRLFGWDDARG